MECTWNETCSERIQRAGSARGTYSGHISHTPETRQAFRKNFKETFSGVQRRAPDVHQAYPTRL